MGHVTIGYSTEFVAVFSRRGAQSAKAAYRSLAVIRTSKQPFETPSMVSLKHQLTVHVLRLPERCRGRASAIAKAALACPLRRVTAEADRSL